MLNVADIDKSIAFYELALGFQLVSSEQDLKAFRWGIIANDSIEFMLSESKGETPQQAVNPLNQSSWLVNFYFYPQDLSRRARAPRAAPPA